MIRACFIFPIPILQVLVNLLFSKNYCDLKTLIHILYHSPFHIILKAVTRSPKRNEAITLLVIASFTISRDKAKLQSVGGFLSSPTDEEEHRLSTQLCVATPM